MKGKILMNNVGVWIDHKKAVVVCNTDDVEEIHSITSDLEKKSHHSGAEPDDMQDNRFNNQIKAYYDKVIACLHDADAILILGPGEAKGEFEKRLKTESFGDRIVGVETEDKMTDHQIAAKVRQHFLNGNGAHGANGSNGHTHHNKKQ